MLTSTSGQGKGDSGRAVRDPDNAGCHCRGTGKGAEKWRQASVLTVDSEGRVEGCGHEERGKKDEWGLSQS